MPLVILFVIIFVIIFVFTIGWLILKAFFALLFLLSTNALLCIEKCFFINNTIPPWVTWGIIGLFIGLLLAAYKSASHRRYRYLRSFFIVLPILVLVGLGSYNANRLREPFGKTTQPGDLKASQPKQHPSTKTDSQKTPQSPTTYNLNGEWDGTVSNKPAKLSITQVGNSIKGNIVYDDFTEHLSGEINNDKIVLRGIGYEGKVKEGKRFALDTFSGIISNQDGGFIHGNYTDEGEKTGTWFVTKLKSSSQVAAQKSISNHDISSENTVSAPLAPKPVTTKPNEEVWDWVFEWKDTAKQLASGKQKTPGEQRDAQLISCNSNVLKFRYKRPSGKIVYLTLARSRPEQFYFGSVALDDTDLRVWLLPDERGNFKGRFDNGPGSTPMEGFLKKRPSENDFKPNAATSAPQARLTKAMQKKPYGSFYYNDMGCHLLLSNAKVTLLHNDSLQISFQRDSFAIDCTWSSSGSAYVGTWQRYEDGRGRVQGTITLWPQYNSDGEIKCFSGYIRNWNDPPADVIKIEPFWCRCSNPPDHNPGAREQYRKPNSPSVHTYETTRSYHWGK